MNQPRIPRIVDIVAALDAPDRNGCWVNPRVRDGDYAGTSIGGRKTSVHRAVYEYCFGEIPAGLHVLHACDNRQCANPRHLFLGTNADNITDRVSKGRSRGGGSPRLDEDKVRAIRKDTRKNHIIAAEYGVSTATIGQVKSRFTWRHVHD